ncbi:MAG: NYN domain-containing protein [Lachnospiraceae bacterium]|nr:NYN domain-containing protein [Lachnospiraceae bacterium]
MNEKIALLIDAENTSVKYIEVVLKELKQYGDISFQRMYGDFSNPKMHEWTKKGLEFAIVPIHQAIYTTGKNAADIMLVIDAMDIMYENNVDVFCIVTSDSDFTRLANRIRESGKRVIGMGKSDASKTFISACNEYKFLDKIMNDESDDDHDNLDNIENSAITPLSEIKMAINYIVQQAEAQGELAHLGSTKSRLQREFADFDERNYGYTLFRKFIEDETKFELAYEGSATYIVRKHQGKAKNVKNKVEKYVLEQAEHSIELGLLGKEINKKFPDFKYNDLGYSKLSKFVESVKGVRIVTDEHNKNCVKLKK